MRTWNTPLPERAKVSCKGIWQSRILGGIWHRFKLIALTLRLAKNLDICIRWHENSSWCVWVNVGIC